LVEVISMSWLEEYLEDKRKDIILCKDLIQKGRGSEAKFRIELIEEILNCLERKLKENE
jgi:hypothetical protein